jgi:hypothetical protein
VLGIIFLAHFVVFAEAARLRQENASLTSKLHMTQLALATASARVSALEAASPLPELEIEMTEMSAAGSDTSALPPIATANPLFAYSIPTLPASDSSTIDLNVSS